MNGIILLDTMLLLALIALLAIPAIVERKQGKQAFNARMKRLALVHIVRGNSAYGQDRYINYNRRDC